MHVKKWKPGLWIFLLCSLILVQLEAFAGIRMPMASPTLLATVSGTAESTAETLSAKWRNSEMWSLIYRRKGSIRQAIK